MFSFPLILLASLVNMLLSLFRPREDGLDWLTALFMLALMTIFGFVAVIAVGNFLFNL